MNLTEAIERFQQLADLKTSLENLLEFHPELVCLVAHMELNLESYALKVLFIEDELDHFLGYSNLTTNLGFIEELMSALRTSEKVQNKIKYFHQQIISEEEGEERQKILTFMYGQKNELANAVKLVVLRQIQECQILDQYTVTNSDQQGNYLISL